jgi:hypothetical protein
VRFDGVTFLSGKCSNKCRWQQLLYEDLPVRKLFVKWHTHIWLEYKFFFISSLHVSELQVKNFRGCYLPKSSIALHSSKELCRLFLHKFVRRRETLTRKTSYGDKY